MAGRTLQLAADMVPTVAGGLTFFGAPLNTYMTHAACAMVRRLRAGGGTGLLYGQGEFVTKHHALVVSAAAPGGTAVLEAASVQDVADAARGPVPVFSTVATGPAALESFTIIYDREGAPSHGVVIGRMTSGERVLARVAGEDDAAIARLTDLAVSPVGAPGRIWAEGEAALAWAFT
jgi:acetyl-CoA C-acetyltransferase